MLIRIYSPIAALLWMVVSPLSAVEAQSDFEPEVRTLKLRVMDLLHERQYTKLESLISGLREEGTRSTEGTYLLRSVYGQLASVPAGKTNSEAALTDRIQQLGAWNNSKQSSAAYVALAHCLCSHAMNARGGGLYGSIAANDLLTMETHLKRAEAALRRAEQINKQDDIRDPCIPRLFLRIGRHQGYELEKMTSYLKQAQEMDPWFDGPIQEMAMTLLPRWSGAPGDLVEFAESYSDEQSEATGQSVYAWVWSMALRMDEPVDLDRGEFEWDRVKQGMLDWLTQYPDSAYILGSTAHYAHMAGDREIAREMLQRLQGRWPTSVWRNEIDYQRTLRWAFDEEKSDEAEHIFEMGPLGLGSFGVIDRNKQFILSDTHYHIPVYSYATGDKVDDIELFPHRPKRPSRHAVNDSIDMTIRLEGKELLQRYNFDSKEFQILGIASDRAHYVRTSNDGNLVALIDIRGNLKIWDVKDDPVPYEWTKVIQGKPSGLEFSPTGDRLLSGGGKTLRIWDTRSYKLLKAWQADKTGLFGLAWSPDGKMIASSGVNSGITFWNAENYEEIGKIETTADAIGNMAFSPDSSFLVAATLQNKQIPDPCPVLVCDTTTLAVTRSLDGHRSAIQGVAVTSDNRILSSSIDGSIRVWPSLGDRESQ